jgi:hypothetical protein
MDQVFRSCSLTILAAAQQTSSRLAATVQPQTFCQQQQQISIQRQLQELMRVTQQRQVKCMSQRKSLSALHCWSSSNQQLQVPLLWIHTLLLLQLRSLLQLG